MKRLRSPFRVIAIIMAVQIILPVSLLSLPLINLTNAEEPLPVSEETQETPLQLEQVQENQVPASPEVLPQTETPAPSAEVQEPTAPKTEVQEPAAPKAETEVNENTCGNPPAKPIYRLEALKYQHNPAVESSWTTGNPCQGLQHCYKDSDIVPSRLTVSNLEVGITYTSGILQFDYLNQDNVKGYKDFTRNGAVRPDVGVNNVQLTLVSNNIHCNDDICANYSLKFKTTAEKVIIYWNSVLSSHASDWSKGNGANLHFRLERGVFCEYPGNHEIPIRVEKIIEQKMTLILKKKIDRGDAKANLWCFKVTPAINNKTEFCIKGDGNNIDTVTLKDIPVKQYMIEEKNIDKYEFAKGEGSNCDFEGNKAKTRAQWIDCVNCKYEATCVFHNQEKEIPVPVTPELFISKSNNRMGQNVLAGETVLFKILVTSTGDIKEVKVTDVMSPDFDYVVGSWTANSSVRGDIKGIVPEPLYNPKGIWKLGNMVEGEVVTLTYIAKISVNQQPGIFKDLAWAKGAFHKPSPCIQNSVTCPAQPSESQLAGEWILILANAESGYFVGTEVKVVEIEKIIVNLPVVEEIVKLVNTGSNIASMATIGGALCLLLSSLPLLMKEVTKRKKTILPLLNQYKQKLARVITLPKLALSSIGVIVISIGLTAFALQKPVYAIDTPHFLAVRVEQPKTPTNKVFHLDFVSLDILERYTVAKCLKKGPDDTNFVTFKSDIVLGMGGGNGLCDATPILTKEGSYKFRVDVKAGTEFVESEIITVFYDNSFPEKPIHYKKSDIGSCKYKLVFTAADDQGETQKIEIYRTTTSSFVANSDSLAGTVNITSKQNGEFVDTKPDCSKTYYYAIRAIDEIGNGSPFVTDTIVKIIKVEETIEDESDLGDEIIPNQEEELQINQADETVTTTKTSDVQTAEKKDDNKSTAVAATTKGTTPPKSSTSKPLTEKLTSIITGSVFSLLAAFGIGSFLMVRGKEDENGATSNPSIKRLSGSDLRISRK